MRSRIFTLNALFCSLLAITSTLSAAQGSYGNLSDATPHCRASQPLLEFKTGYFMFSNSKMRKIYDRGGLDIQLCASYPLWNLTDRWTLNAYGALEYFHRTGTSMNGHQKTSLWSVPVNIGLKQVFAMNANTQYYFTIGPREIYIHQHNHSPYVPKHQSRNGLGFFANTGLHYDLCNRLILDIFGEYSYAKLQFHGRKSNAYTRKMQIGGFTFGGGLGREF